MANKWLKSQQGQSFVLIALVLTGLIAMMGLAIDGGITYFQRREVQNASDASAFAGGKALIDPANSGKDRAAECAIRRKIEQYAIANGVPGTQTDSNCNTLNSNVNAYFITQDGTQVGTTLGRNYYVPTTATGVCVVNKISSRTFFLGVVGQNFSTVSSTGCVNSTNAVCGGGMTLWAGSTTCNNAIYMNGQNSHIGGGSHSNNDYYNNGNNNDLGAVETVNGFEEHGAHTVGTFKTTGVLPLPTPHQTYYNNGDYFPGGRAALAAGANYHRVVGDKNWSTNGEVINGLWYVEGNVKFSGNQQSGNLTVVATGKIELAGNGQNNAHPPDFTPYIDGLLFYSNYTPSASCTDDKTIYLNGNNFYYNGIIMAPNGQIYLNGNNGDTLKGTLIGKTVYVNGNNSSLSYDAGLVCGSVSTIITKPK